MTEVPADPHVHAELNVVSVAQLRSRLTQVVGRAVSIPTSITTGCGQRRPLAATSHIPERVTCLPCREHARRAHDARATALENLAALAVLEHDHASHLVAEARRHRELAHRYST